MTKHCNKKKYDKIGAMIALASCQKSGRFGNSKRNECRLYYCDICKSYHLTSKRNTTC